MIDWMQKCDGLMVSELIEMLASYKVVLYKDGDKLKYKGREKLITADLLIIIKAKKCEILEYLGRFEKNETGKEFALTPIQDAYLIGRGSGCELGNVNAHYYVEYEMEDIDAKRLEQAINILVTSYDALRTIVYRSGHQKVMKQAPKYKVAVKNIETDEAILQVRKRWEGHQYALEDWPMFHMQVSKRKGKADVFYFSFDCMVLDAWSAKKMTAELMELYNGKQVSFPDFTFESYIQSVEEYKRANIDETQAEMYWEEKVQALPSYPHLPMKKEMQEVERPTFKRLEHTFSQNETNRIYDLVKHYKFTPAVAVCTVFLKTLSVFSANSDLTVNLTLFNRFPVDKEVDALLGEFTNIGLVQYAAGSSKALEDEVKEIQKQFWKLIQFRTYDGTQILKKLSCGDAGKAIMPVVFTSMLTGELSDNYLSGFREVYAISQTPQVFLDHHARDDLGTLKLSWDYVEELFNIEQVGEMFRCYVEAVGALADEDTWNSAEKNNLKNI